MQFLVVSQRTILFIVFLLPYVLGVLTILHAVRYTRTSQGAIAWVLSLLFIPHFSLLVYWLLGPHKFQSYLHTIQNAKLENKEAVLRLRQDVDAHQASLPDSLALTQRMLTNLFPWPITSGNRVRLLINATSAYPAILDAIQNAKQSILVQFYIYRDDEIGNKIQAALMERAQAGVAVYFLVDGFGSFTLSEAFLDELRDAGVHVAVFGSSRNVLARLSVNFRNHRKIVVTDGAMAFVGGINVGDEYLQPSRRFGNWRDTHVAIEGPAISVVQASFVEDWYFTTQTFPDLCFENALPVQDSHTSVLPLYTGPTSEFEDCGLMFTEAISKAQKRFWLATPYFVPDKPLSQALQGAVLKGVDVRLLVPRRPDHLVVWLASYSYFKEMLDAGVKVHLYSDGFMHQKVFLVDDVWSSVGSANFDNRSLRLNFEMSVLVFDREFASSVEEMLQDDFEHSTLLRKEDLDNVPLYREILSQLAKLFSPVL